MTEATMNPTVSKTRWKLQPAKPVYKLVTDETWNVYVELSDTTAKELADTEQIKTRIDKDSETIWADFSILQKDGTYFGKLTYTDSMIRYCEDRYLHIELIMEDESGLKIPKSAVVEKPFYMIPKEYLTSSGSGSSTGIMIQKDGEITYQDITVYAESEDGYVYVNPNELDKHTVLVKPDQQKHSAQMKNGRFKAYTILIRDMLFLN